jgi:hypothetical protein
MRSQLLSEISRSGRRRWLQVDEMPFSRAIKVKARGGYKKEWVPIKGSTVDAEFYYQRNPAGCR